jgi:hypothetical protein
VVVELNEFDPDATRLLGGTARFRGTYLGEPVCVEVLDGACAIRLRPSIAATGVASYQTLGCYVDDIERVAERLERMRELNARGRLLGWQLAQARGSKEGAA